MKQHYRISFIRCQNWSCQMYGLWIFGSKTSEKRCKKTHRSKTYSNATYLQILWKKQQHQTSFWNSFAKSSSWSDYWNTKHDVYSQLACQKRWIWCCLSMKKLSKNYVGNIPPKKNFREIGFSGFFLLGYFFLFFSLLIKS